MRDPLFFEKRDLPGGAQLFHQHREMSWSGMVIMVLAGHMHDDVGKEGTAHLLEHQVSNGRIGDLPAMTSEDLGAWLNDNRMMVNFGATSLYWTRYGGSAENANVGLLARFLTDLVFRPGLDGDLEHEREIVRAERMHRVAGRGERVSEMVERSAYGGHRRVTATGLPKDAVLDAIARADIESFHRRYYAPANVRIVTVGGAGIDEMHATLQGLVPAPRLGQVTVGPIPSMDLRPPDPREIFVEWEDGRPAESVSIRWRWRMPYDTGRLGAMVAGTLRRLLHQRVREDQRAVYGIGADSGFQYDHSSFSISTKVDADKLHAVREEVVRTLRDADAISRTFRRQADEFEVDEIFFDRTCADITENAVSQVSAYGRVATLAETLAEARAVTETDVLDFVRSELDPEDAQVVIVERQ